MTVIQQESDRSLSDYEEFAGKFSAAIAALKIIRFDRMDREA